MTDHNETLKTAGCPALNDGKPASSRPQRWAWASGNKIFRRRFCCGNRIYRPFSSKPTTRPKNPLWHGEVHTLKRFYEMTGSERPDSRELIFPIDP